MIFVHNQLEQMLYFPSRNKAGLYISIFIFVLLLPSIWLFVSVPFNNVIHISHSQTPKFEFMNIFFIGKAPFYIRSYQGKRSRRTQKAFLSTALVHYLFNDISRSGSKNALMPFETLAGNRVIICTLSAQS